MTRRLWGILALALAGGLGWLDYHAGLGLSLSLLYLVPIAMGAWFSGRREGILLSVLCAELWCLADLKGAGRPYDHPAETFRNAAMQLGLFLTFGLVLSALRQALKARGWPVTVSIGAVTFLSPPASLDEMIHHADTLMYAVKGSGKNALRQESVA